MKCCEKIKSKFLIASAGCSEDNAAVASLPQLLDQKNSGPVLHSFLKAQEKKHQEVLNVIASEAAKINESVDVEIRVISENLVEHIKQNQNAINSVISNYDTEEGELSKDDHEKALSLLNNLLHVRIGDIERFKQEALRLERKRASALQVILRDKFEHLISIGHYSPKRLLHDFDNRIYEINQQLLSNERAYAELEASLRLQADESKLHGRSSLKLLKLGVSILSRKQSTTLFHARKRTSQGRSSNAIERKSTASVQSTGRIFDSIDIFDQCVSRMVQAYKTALINVFIGFSRKLEDLGNDIYRHEIILGKDYGSEILDIHPLIERTLRHLSNIVYEKPEHHNEFKESTEKDVVKMQKSLISLGNSLRHTYAILHDAGHLCDTHILRSAIAQKLTIVAVEDLLTSNDISELSTEVSFNINLEQMRCAPDLDKLQILYNIQVAALERVSELYQHHSESEICRLEEFLNLQPYLSKCLILEYKYFLHKYTGSNHNITLTPEEISNPVSYRGNAEIPRALLKSALHEVSLQNWKNGFLETFRNSVDLIPKELNLQALLWVRERVAVLRTRYSIKNRLHNIRFERITAARDARSAELCFHQERLNSHLDAINKLIETLPVIAADCCTLDSPELYPLQKNVTKMQADLDNLMTKDTIDREVKKLKTKSYAVRLTNYLDCFRKSLEDVMEMNRMSLERKVQEVRIANVRFMSGIKLFHEGGRFAVAEAIRTTTFLVKASDALELCLNRSKEIINQRRTQLLSWAEQNVLQLKKLFDEVLKTNGKSGMDRRKIPFAKKM